MKFRPLGNNIVVKKALPGEAVSKSGLIHLLKPVDVPCEGEVLAVGKGKYNLRGIFVECDVAVGDRVLFGKHSGTVHKIEGEEVLIMQDTDVLGVIAPGTPLTASEPEAEVPIIDASGN